MSWKSGGAPFLDVLDEDPPFPLISAASTLHTQPGSHALLDYQTQLELLEQQNKKRLLMARQEQDIISASTSTKPKTMELNLLAPGRVVQESGESHDVDSMAVKDLNNVLDGADGSKIDLQKLQEYIGLLQAKARQFEVIREKQASSRYQILHRLVQRGVSRDHRNSRSLDGRYSTPFFDHPEWVKGQENQWRIQSSLPLHNFDLYLEKNKDVAFLVYRNFDTASASIKAKPESDDVTKGKAKHLPQYTSENIQPVNKDLVEAIKTLLSSRVEYSELLLSFTATNELTAPYLFVYHNRKGLEELQNDLSSSARAQLSLLSDYVTNQFAEEYSAADSALSQGKISPDHIPYLFKPQDLLVQRSDGQYQGYVATSW